VVAAVRGGLLSLAEACQRYSLTTEEFQAWQSQVPCVAARKRRPIVARSTATDAKIAMLHEVIRVSGADVGEMLIRGHVAVRWGNGRPDWCVQR